MLKHRQQTLQRFDVFRRQLEEALYAERAPIELAAFAAPGRIGHAEAMAGAYEPIDVGHAFGPAWSTHWVRVAYTIPEAWKGREVHLRWDASGEACVWEDGRVQQGLTTGHRTEYRLARSAQGGETGTLYIEVACNSLFGMGAHPGGEKDWRGDLKCAELAVFDREAWDLLWDFATVAEAAQELPEDSPQAGCALRTANEMVNTWRENDRASWAEARAAAHAFLDLRNGDGQHRLSAVGHAHIDTAWLWPLAETRRKCYRTFASALRYMDDYPEYRFACSQAQQWAWMKESHPELYEQMKIRAAEGRFVPAGGTWVEPDCNIPSGESLVRQFLVGQRFFEAELGAPCRVFWNPDVFGYSGQLPQILRGAEIEGFLTQKLSWNQFNKIPHHTFFWEGLDGSRILTHFPPADTYNANASIHEILRNVRNYKDHATSRESYYLFGYGDGGGGPTPEMLERLRRVEDLDGLPRTEIRTPDVFFDRLREDATDLLVWVGELYLELHRGTYTTHARNKLWNRRCEGLLHDVECLHAVVRPDAYPHDELERLWRLVLLNQFHDIIPGSSITEVYRDSEGQYRDVLASGGALLTDGLSTLAGDAGRNLIAVNALGHPRREVAERPDGSGLALLDLPALGYTVADGGETDEAASIEDAKEGFVLENACLRALVGKDGRLHSLVHKASGREAVEPGGRGNHLVLFDDRPANWEAWDVDVYHLEKSRPVGSPTSIRVVEEGPLRVAVEATYDVGKASTLTQRIQLTAVGRRLDFVTDVDWHEHRQFLKAEFPWSVRAMTATYEIQFGHLERPTHFNTTWDMARFEVCAQRWADLHEHGFGVALLNDCKYGHATHANVMRLSLLRSPKAPDPEADMGKHRFTYAVMPHTENLQEAGVIEEAMNLNAPPLLAATGRRPESVSWFSVDRPGLVIDTVKKAEASDHVVLRLYEAHGARGTFRLSSSLPVRKAWRCNLLERDDRPVEWNDGGTDLAVRPFELLTLKLALSDGV